MRAPSFLADRTVMPPMVPWSLSCPPEKAKKIVESSATSAPLTHAIVASCLVLYGSDQNAFFVIVLANRRPSPASRGQEGGSAGRCARPPAMGDWTARLRAPKEG